MLVEERKEITSLNAEASLLGVFVERLGVKSKDLQLGIEVENRFQLSG